MSQAQSAAPVQIPTVEQLTAQASNLIIQRAQLKDQIEGIEKQLPVVQGMIQLLTAQADAAKVEASKDE